MKASTVITAAALAISLGIVGAAHASTLYDNGALNGLVGAYTVTSPYAVTDSFTLASPSALSSVSVGLWVVTGDAPATVDWAIGSTAGASDLGSGSGISLSNTFLATHAFVYPYSYDDYSSSFPVSATLPAGTYWLTLQNGTTTDAGNLFWDKNSGPSSAFDSSLGVIPSEPFQIYGTEVPEPASLGMLGIGAAMVLARRRRA